MFRASLKETSTGQVYTGVLAPDALVVKQIDMGAGANQVKLIANNTAHQQPVRLDVSVAIAPPIAPQRVIVVALWQRIAGQKQKNQRAQLAHVLATL
jgi:hypothetical protein